MLNSIIIQKKDLLTALLPNECAIIVEDPLIESRHPLRTNWASDRVLFVSYHDINPNGMHPGELLGLVPFDASMAEEIRSFVKKHAEAPELWTLIVACPHGRARGNSIAASLLREYPGIPLRGSVVPEAVNSFVVDMFCEARPV